MLDDRFDRGMQTRRSVLGEALLQTFSAASILWVIAEIRGVA
ncbi:hypothetical protein [Salipiger thiooxidans]|nr:hypothetical protein [Salipiger thiooxidans]